MLVESSSIDRFHVIAVGRAVDVLCHSNGSLGSCLLVADRFSDATFYHDRVRILYLYVTFAPESYRYDMLAVSDRHHLCGFELPCLP